MQFTCCTKCSFIVNYCNKISSWIVLTSKGFSVFFWITLSHEVSRHFPHTHTHTHINIRKLQEPSAYSLYNGGYTPSRRLTLPELSTIHLGIQEKKLQLLRVCNSYSENLHLLLFEPHWQTFLRMITVRKRSFTGVCLSTGGGELCGMHAPRHPRPQGMHAPPSGMHVPQQILQDAVN